MQTNNRVWSASEVVFEADDCCNHENLLAQLHGGVRALCAQVNTLESNGAWIVMTALVWNRESWWALMLMEVPGHWQGQHREEKRHVLRQEFKSLVTIPCLMVQTGRRLVLRVLGWNRG